MTFVLQVRYFQRAPPCCGREEGEEEGETVYINHPGVETCFAGADPEK